MNRRPLLPHPTDRPTPRPARPWWTPAVPLLLVTALLPMHAGTARAAAVPNTWSPTSALNGARVYHTATLLQDGRVLVAAGGTTDCCIYLNTAELYTPATGAWTPTGSLHVARNQHTATLLPDGRVLVAGGFGIVGSFVNATLTAAELYNPATGAWTVTASMATSRAGHTATLFPNGKVLVAGGSTANAFSTSSAELYDPATGAWTPTGSMTTPRWRHTATLLPDGQVLVAGGLGPTNNTLASAELYDPATGAWTPTGAMATARNQHTATLLPDGRVLVAGGCGDPSCGGSIAAAELYNPATGAWTPTGSLRGARGQHTASLLPGGQVLVAGGCCSTGQLSLALAELYNPATGLWAPTGPMTTPRSAHTATLLPTGQVLAVGGCTNTVACSVTPGAELYTPGAGPLAIVTPTSLSFGVQPVGAPSPPLAVAVINAGGQPLNVTALSLSGTNSADFADTTSCLARPVAPGATCTILVTFAPAAKGTRSAGLTIGDNAPSGPQTIALAGAGSGPSAWATTGLMTAARAGHTATLLPSGLVLVTGGGTSELYNPATGLWTASGPMIAARFGHTATLLPDGKVLVAGGCCAGTSALASAELYDPASGSWSATGSMHAVRQYHTATLLPNGKVLVAGGCNYACGPGTTGAELYDPTTGSWTQAASMHVARASHTATLLPAGLVLVAGGCCAVTASAELYNPATGAWTPTGSLRVARGFQTATLLPSGRVLVAGGDTQRCSLAGCSTPAVAATELYNPASGTWARGASMNGARGNHTAALLATGQVLVAGGCADGAGCLARLAAAEVYDPASDAWATTSPMSTTRVDATATLLPGGRVLAAGGDCCRTAELYTTPLLAVGAAIVTPTQSVAVTGAAFPAPDFAGQETVRVYWDSVSTTPLVTATLGVRGAFAAALVVPPAATGAHALIAVAQVSGAAAVRSVLVDPR